MLKIKRDENMAKILTQLNILTKHVMGEKNVNAIAAVGDVVYDNIQYEEGYSKKVHYWVIR